MTHNSALKDDRPLLTVAIPTYNRSRYLRELLENLQAPLRGELRVELIVSDNCSADDTPAVVAEFQARGMQIHSIRNSVNLGADGNFVQCYEAARGKYFWIIGDDDLLAPGALSSLLDRLQTEEYDMIYLSQFGIKEPVGELEHKQIRNAVEISSAEEFARRIHVFFTFISANIVNKDTIMRSHPKPFKDLTGSLLVQVGWTFAALDGFNRGLLVYDAVLGARDNIAGGYQLFDVFGPKLKAIAEDRIQSRKVQRAIFNGTLRHYLPLFAVKYRRSRIPFREECSPQARLTPAFKDYLSYWAFLYPVLALPLPLAIAWYLPLHLWDRSASRFLRWRHV